MNPVLASLNADEYFRRASQGSRLQGVRGVKLVRKLSLTLAAMRQLFLLGFASTVVGACAQPLEWNGAPVTASQMEHWKRFHQISSGASQAHVEQVYGKTARWWLEYGDGIAFFENDQLKWISGPLHDNRKKPLWAVDVGMQRATFENKVGKPTIECGWYYIAQYEHIFCYRAGRLERKARELPPLV